MFPTLIKLQDPRAPVLFQQVRPGLHERPFTILKFRTMSDSRDPDGRLKPDGDRLDRFGRALRAASLDELPELWNVLRGDMSIVGPRPLLMAYLSRYTRTQRRRQEAMELLARVRHRIGTLLITIGCRMIGAEPYSLGKPPTITTSRVMSS